MMNVGSDASHTATSCITAGSFPHSSTASSGPPLRDLELTEDRYALHTFYCSGYLCMTLNEHPEQFGGMAGVNWCAENCGLLSKLGVSRDMVLRWD